jgi:TadE-like protein
MQLWTTAKNIVPKLGARLRQERGQALVEFAVVLPILILIVLGIVYFGRYEDYANQETHLAEAGVRSAAVGWMASGYTMPASCTTPNNTLQCYLRGQAQPELQNGSSDVTQAQIWIYQPLTAPNYVTGQPIRVCVVSTVTFPSPIGAPSATMAQTATMLIEHVATGVLPSSNPWAAGNPGPVPPSQCPTS